MKALSGHTGFLKIIYALIISSLPFSCTNQGSRPLAETPTSGDIRIESDESFRPIIDAQISTFTSLYTNARITPSYKPERDIIADFLNDSVKVIVTSWVPSQEQTDILMNSHIAVRTTVVAHDALALVVSRSNNNSLLTYDNVKDIFTGKVTGWKEINPDSELGDIRIIFDNNKSGNIRYFREKFDLPEQLSPNYYAVETSPDVIDYVSKSPDAIGIISANWISDRDDSLCVSFTDRVKVVGVSQEYLDRNSFYRPEQGAIYSKIYPFTRDINMVSRESFNGLGTGFISWVAGEKGQRIILKSGIVPATMPIRLIQVSKE